MLNAHLFVRFGTHFHALARYKLLLVKTCFVNKYGVLSDDKKFDFENTSKFVSKRNSM